MNSTSISKFEFDIFGRILYLDDLSVRAYFLMKVMSHYFAVFFKALFMRHKLKITT